MSPVSELQRPLRDDAVTIWQAAVNAVRSDKLVRSRVHYDGHRLQLGTWVERAEQVGRIVVVGAGKASGGMAEGLETALGPSGLERFQLSGWINVPDPSVRPLRRIRLHGARPAGHNEPTAGGEYGTKQILRLVEQLEASDVCIVLLSGGGSALLPLPVSGVDLQDKLAVTRRLSAAGASIQQLNTVRRALSAIKGGGLARACRAGQLISLIISDVLDDDLQTIASGPTVPVPSDPQAALHVWRELGLSDAELPPNVARTLERVSREPRVEELPTAHLFNQIIGNNRTAVEAAAATARELGYLTLILPPESAATTAEAVGGECYRLLSEPAGPGPSRHCIVWGGEPVVKLIDPSHRGTGGRNQQLVLAALNSYLADLSPPDGDWVLLSAGTDGEDGPTNAAGAILDSAVRHKSRHRAAQARDALRRNDAYTFFTDTGGLFQTGPTGTNVCDVRVMLTDGLS